MHAVKLEPVVRDRLPDRGPQHYYAHLQSGRAALVGHLEEHRRLPAHDRALLATLVRRCDGLLRHWDAVERASARTPWTFVHGDLFPKNLRVRREADRLACLVFDWEGAGWGPPAPDLVELRAQPSALGTYAATLRRRRPEMRAEDVWRQAELGVVLWLIRVISHEMWGWRGPLSGHLLGKLRAYEPLLARGLSSLAAQS
jgi:hypothetical protein